MRSSLVLGANGQDGSYLCEALVEHGHRVIGVSKQADYRWSSPKESFEYLTCDLRDSAELAQLLSDARPDHIHHVAAVHGPSGFAYENVFADVIDVSVVSVHVCLEYLRERASGSLFYASSAKAFGEPLRGVIDERTPLRASCLYSTAKIAGSNLIDCYRRDHGVTAVVAYLFNHESPRREGSYFVPRIARALANALEDRDEQVEVRSLDFHADWGSAQQYMQMVARATMRGLDGHFVFASGETRHAAAAVSAVFAAHGFDYRQWLRAPSADDGPKPVPFVTDPGRIRTAVEAPCGKSFEALVNEMALHYLGRRQPVS